MKNFRSKMERFFFRNRNKGIPNLMLWVIGSNVLVYIFANMGSVEAFISYLSYLSFDRDLILQGQVWRLFTFIFLELTGNGIFFALLAAIFYYQLGGALENTWGTFKFNFYYLTGWLISVIIGMIFGHTTIGYVHLSLFIAYATLYPDTEFRIFFIIPIKARWLGILDLAITLFDFVQFDMFPFNLIAPLSLANYFIYFGKDFVRIFPDSWRINTRRLFRKKGKSTENRQRGKTVPFHPTGAYESDHASPKAPYTHKCTICGKTDISNPGLEFRYCSRCKGYHCYCIDHINNHTHVE